jgi:pyruvate formate lyase activating enzyme
VDLKGFSDEFYAEIGSMAKLGPVLDTIKTISDEGVWLEITNLLIPGLNDDPETFGAMCSWIRENTGADTPLHISRFHPQYKLRKLPMTPARTLINCYGIARAEGLNFVYIGNVPGNPHESTYCPGCGATVIKRRGYTISEKNISDGKCVSCGRPIPGVWELKR